MWIEKIDAEKRELYIAIPLTNGTGKTRVKTRSFFNEYSYPVATCSKPFTQSCYIEWQIGYDVITSEDEKLSKSTLPDITFCDPPGDGCMPATASWKT